MNTKLTLTIEQSVIEKAKQYARKQERSLSDLIENYLKVLISEEAEDKEALPTIVKSLKGSFTEPNEFNYKKELTDCLAERYL